ncbi:hypothetical protein [Mycobacterium sp. Aquia_213]|uniref:hypothetical protein n=1 Tax=Mycobacterium sp. Aquia_213 TaxID=2991728 RepID=UPI00226DC924|nr:hypothetical protein [Mycobacterium sp. Aquia_213]WAC93567.1 hypothetical protein LMQ14_10765 [Mycobacterium sp. Aquia_213]
MSGWYYTPGWGALGTVSVAALAVGVNILTNRRTLRASQKSLNTSVAQFRQVREDARVDKLRIEVIGLINALAERKTRLDVAINRIDQAIGTIDRTDNLASDLVRVDRSMRAIMASEYWDVYGRCSAHATAIRLLTNDDAILKLVNEIQTIVAREREHYELAVIGRDIHNRPKADLELEGALDDRIRAATKSLVSYCLANLAMRPLD